MANETILVVEDEVLVGEEIREELTRFGYRVPEVIDNGEEVEAAVVRCAPALILMDVRLGGAVDGIEAASRVRASSDIPVIFLTAYSDQETLVRAADTKPDGYLLKPFSERELLANVAMTLAKPRVVETELSRSEPFLAALGVPGFLLDADGRIRYANELGLEFIGREALEAVKGLDFDELFRPDSGDGVLRTVTMPKGRRRTVGVRFEKIESVGGALIGALAVVESMSRKDRAHLERSVGDANDALQARLPSSGAAGPGYAVCGFLLPSPTGSGDLYDVFQLDEDRFAFYALDVMGHGVLPSLFAFSLHDVVRLLASRRVHGQLPSPSHMAEALNGRYSGANSSSLFFTLVYGDVDRRSGAFRYVRAGHTPLLHIPADGPARALFEGGPALGAFFGVGFEEGSGTLMKGDRLVICSDGLVEGEAKDLSAGVDAILAKAAAGKTLDARVFAASLKAAALGRIGADPAVDDASMLVIDRLAD